MRRLLLIGVCLLGLVPRAEAQRVLHVATWTHVSTVAADQVTTVWAMHRGAVEQDALIKWAGPSPAGIVAAGVLLDAGMFWAVQRFVVPHHPRIASVLLFTKSGLHVRAVQHNAHVIQMLGCQSICRQ